MRFQSFLGRDERFWNGGEGHELSNSYRSCPTRSSFCSPRPEALRGEVTAELPLQSNFPSKRSGSQNNPRPGCRRGVPAGRAPRCPGSPRRTSFQGAAHTQSPCRPRSCRRHPTRLAHHIQKALFQRASTCPPRGQGWAAPTHRDPQCPLPQTCHPCGQRGELGEWRGESLPPPPRLSQGL